MTYDNFTTKSQEAIMKGQQIAGGLDQQQVDTPHLIAGILQTDEDVSKFLLQKMNVNILVLKKQLDDEVRKYPKVEGSEKQFLTNDANKALAAAKKMLPEFGDEYISLELMMLGILKGKDKGASILKDQGATIDGLKAAIQELRKGKSVTDQSADGTYNSLKKFAVNLND
ncbi:MAG: type VI secretion system ATPase TssH, partial [Bacteroidetes bacterium]